MDNYITTSSLRNRGWSERLILRLLGEPDKLAINPHYRSGPKIRLYQLTRVEHAETNSEFQAYQAERRRRSQIALEIAAHKRTTLIAQIEAMQITVQAMDIDQLMRRSLQHWENNGPEWDEEVRNGSGADDLTRSRWAVNYARHHLTVYDESLERVAGKIGVVAAIDGIRQKIYGAIAKQWPVLAAECKRQLAQRQQHL